MDDVSTIVVVGVCLWGAGQGLSWALSFLLEKEKLKLKRAQLQDQMFRDACDTIHHLRVENDALTAMVMSMQKERGR